jgi:hypothetical protein
VKTEDLVSMLSTGAEPVNPKRVAWRYLLAVIGGTLAAFALMAAALKLNPALPQELAAPSPARGHLIFGRTARVCPFLITMIAAPLFIALVWALRGLAPTRLRLTGAAAGFAAGSIGALAYSLHCPELAAPFIGTWYLLGITISATLGAWAGPQLLRW